MTSLTPEQKDYKEKTLNQLLINLPVLEAQLAQETRPEMVHSLGNELEEIQAHIDLLQQELAANVNLQPVADELCKQAASALVKQKFYMARRYINKLEAIEPFYPALDRLKRDAETGHVSRRTRTISQSDVLPTFQPAVPSARLASGGVANAGQLVVPPAAGYAAEEEQGRGGIRQFFQLHIILSCLVILVILCVMAGVGGVSLFEWLIKGL